MVSRTLPYFLLAALLPLQSTARPCNESKPFDWAKTKSVLAFGDSYTYVQGTAGRTNFSFIGDQLNLGFNAKTLLNDKIVIDHTSAGGKNWVEYLTGCVEGKPSLCTGKGQRQLWDFATGGADISIKYLPLHHDYSLQLEDQVVQWDTYAKQYLPVKPAEALAAIWIGINDINDSAKNTTITDFNAFYQTIVSTLFESMKKVSDAGYKTFLFMKLPPLDRTQSNLGNAAAGKPLYPNTTQINWYNDALESGAQAFGQREGVKVMVFDTYKFLNGVIDNASQYGLKNTTAFCPQYNVPDIDTNYAAYGCLPIGQYFWYSKSIFHSELSISLSCGRVELTKL